MRTKIRGSLCVVVSNVFIMKQSKRQREYLANLLRSEAGVGTENAGAVTEDFRRDFNQLIHLYLECPAVRQLIDRLLAGSESWPFPLGRIRALHLAWSHTIGNRPELILNQLKPLSPEAAYKFKKGVGRSPVDVISALGDTPSVIFYGARDADRTDEVTYPVMCYLVGFLTACGFSTVTGGGPAKMKLANLAAYKWREKLRGIGYQFPFQPRSVGVVLNVDKEGINPFLDPDFTTVPICNLPQREYFLEIMGRVSAFVTLQCGNSGLIELLRGLTDIKAGQSNLVRPFSGESVMPLPILLGTARSTIWKDFIALLSGMVRARFSGSYADEKIGEVAELAANWFTANGNSRATAWQIFQKIHAKAVEQRGVSLMQQAALANPDQPSLEQLVDQFFPEILDVIRQEMKN